MTSGLLRPRTAAYPNLTSALRSNEPSRFEDKIQNDRDHSHDPIVDHVMRSRAFKAVIWSFSAMLFTIGLVITGLGPDTRMTVLQYGGAAVIFFWVPFMTLFVLPCSRRLR